MSKSKLFKLIPGLSSAYHRNFSTLPPRKPIEFTPLDSVVNVPKFVVEFPKVISRSYGHLIGLDEVSVYKKEDIELTEADKFGQVIFASVSGAVLRYGDWGIAPSSSKKPVDLLKYDMEIPPESFGVINVKKHVPFLIDDKNRKDSLAITEVPIEKVYDYEENIKRYSLNVLCPLTPDDARRLSLGLQSRIFHDYKKEDFYEETTSKVYQPTIYNKSSGTLMNFEDDENKSKTTATHYHPGERSLYIVTTSRSSGATLNFCGVAENPDLRKDCEVNLNFPKNSIVILNFPAFTHHKFHGNFVCVSVHPREGVNLIDALNSGKLTKGFLESATVFSVTDKTPEKWSLSFPEQSPSPSPSKTGVTLKLENREGNQI